MGLLGLVVLGPPDVRAPVGPGDRCDCTCADESVTGTRKDARAPGLENHAALLAILANLRGRSW